MSQEQWTGVDRYITDLLAPNDDALQSALRDSAEGGLPSINVTPNQGKLVQMLAEMVGAKRILEIGTLGGYSTIWLARGLAEGGSVVTLEAQEKHAAVARKNIERAGLSKQVEIVVGLARETLPKISSRGPF